ncbi:MAG: transcriptional regulator LysR family [Herminiimonas sp.]|nr:transcriptional regulator LysR family [Herminiimonas sp.]
MGDRLTEIEAFLKIADEKNLSGAARALNYSPSAMSKLIQRLENRLGVRLINRTSRAFSLTKEGEMFYREGTLALEAVKHAEQVVAGKSPVVSGVLRVACSLQIAQFYLAPLIPAFLDLHPDLDVNFVLKGVAVPLVEHQIDVGIVAEEPTNSSFVARKIASVSWTLCASPAYLNRAGIPTDPSDLVRHQCLNFLPGAEQSWRFQLDGETRDMVLSGRLRSNSGDLLRVFAIMGLGVVRVPLVQVRDEINSGVLIPILQQYQDETPEPLYAVYQSARNLSPRTIAFLKFLDKSFRDPAFKSRMTKQARQDPSAAQAPADR